MRRVTSRAAPGPACPAHHGRTSPCTAPSSPPTRPRSTGRCARTARSRRSNWRPACRANLVTGYAAALDVLRNPERVRQGRAPLAASARAKVPPDSPVLPMMMYRPNALFTDGAQHARLRGAVTDSLARVDPHALRGYVERSADPSSTGSRRTARPTCWASTRRCCRCWSSTSSSAARRSWVTELVVGMPASSTGCDAGAGQRAS